MEYYDEPYLQLLVPCLFSRALPTINGDLFVIRRLDRLQAQTVKGQRECS